MSELAPKIAAVSIWALYVVLGYVLYLVTPIIWRGPRHYLQ